MESSSKIQQIVFNKHDLMNLFTEKGLEGILTNNHVTGYSSESLSEIKLKLLEIKKSKEKYLKNFKMIDQLN